MQRHDVASTLRRRYIYVMCPLGLKQQLQVQQIITVELQWLEHHWDHANLFETWLV